jgi:hypothetical protein
MLHEMSHAEVKGAPLTCARAGRLHGPQIAHVVAVRRCVPPFSMDHFRCPEHESALTGLPRTALKRPFNP